MLRTHARGWVAAVVFTAAACGGGKAATTASSSTGSHASGSGGASAGSTTGSGGTGAGTTTATGTGGTTAASTTSASSSSGSGGGTSAGGIFQAVEPWNTAVDQDPVDPQSDTIIQWLANAGGWGNGDKLQIDTSINIQHADASTPMVPFVLPNGPCGPDCDNVTSFPVPPGGAVEGETGYACNSGGDCHLLVVDSANSKLYEMYQAFSPPDPNVFNSGGGAIIWDLTKAYPPNLRGDGCTSADAGGFPIAAMLFTADEVAAGHIDHAIRFILPNARIRDGDVYVHPGTHTGVTSTPQTRPDAPPYGVHIRLKASFDLTKLPSAGAQTVAKAMQKYGMFLADGGNIALTAADDTYTTAKWTDADVNVDSHAMYAIQVTDFEVVNLGTIITTGDTCVRNP
jgi:serine/threonine-protein kinase